MCCKLAWHSPVAFLGLLLGLLPYVLLAIIIRNKLTVYVGVCAGHRRKRRNAILAGVLGSLVGFLLFIAGAGSARRVGGGLILIGLALLILAIIYGILASRIVWPKVIRKDRAWVKGVCPAFLADLPEYLP